MSNAETDKVVSDQAQLACLEVAKAVIAKAKQTNTPIIVFAGDRIQQLPLASMSRWLEEVRTHQRMARIIPNDSNSPRP